MGRYRKLPIEIDAVQWTGFNEAEIAVFMGLPGCGQPARFILDGGNTKIWVAANSAYLDIEVGEWVAKDKMGCYPIKDEIFQVSYEEVSSDAG